MDFSDIAKFKLMISAPRKDEPDKLNTWVKYEDILIFKQMVFDCTGVDLPPYPKSVIELDSSSMDYHRVCSKADYKRIEKQVKEEKRILATTNDLAIAREEFISRKRFYVAIDFEQYEKCHSKITGKTRKVQITTNTDS